MFETKFPHLWAFFDGAFQANSGGRAKVEDFAGFTQEDMIKAELQLSDFTLGKVNRSHWLGMQADSGYTVTGQLSEEDDEQHKLMAFTLLDTKY